MKANLPDAIYHVQRMARILGKDAYSVEDVYSLSVLWVCKREMVF